ncbi:MAG: hypothetical protein ACE5D1_01415 [Fidelibacterota bacterium]
MNFKRLFPLVLFFSLIRGIGTDFLSVPVSVDELALRPNPVLGRQITSNPALAPAYHNSPVITLASGPWLGGARSTLLGYGWGRKSWTARTQVRYVGLEGLELRTDRPTDNPVAEYGAYGVSGDQVLATDRSGYRLGVAVHWIWMQLYDRNSVGGALDLGLRKRVSPQIQWGVSLLNVGRVSPFQTGKTTLPMRLLTGGSYRFKTGAVLNTLALSGEWSSHVTGMILTVSNEVTWKQLRVLFGSQISREVTVISAGLTLRTGRFELGYAFQAGSQGLGLPQTIELSTRLP